MRLENLTESLTSRDKMNTYRAKHQTQTLFDKFSQFNTFVGKKASIPVNKNAQPLSVLNKCFSPA